MAIKNLLFIPAYNCRPQITRVLDSLIPYTGYFEEILVIDNRSSDGTPDEAREFIRGKAEFRNTKILRNPVNLNLGGTHKMAFLYAIENGFDHVMILHGDDQGDISDFGGVLEKTKQHVQHEFFFGARFTPQSRLRNYSRLRILGNRAFNIFASIINQERIPDLGGSGINLFPVELIKKHPYREYADDLTFHVFLLLNAVRLKQRKCYVPITWTEDDQISNVRISRQALKLFKILMANFTGGRFPITDAGNSFRSHPREWESL